MIRVLIADDSAFMRKVLSDLFKSQSDFEVVGTAVNGQDAIEKVKKFQPDVLTLDVIMPVMDGLNALAVIMEQCPLPVVMVSSTTQKGTNETIRALSLGAVDFVSKAGGAISKIDTIKDEILMKCRLAAKTHARKSFAASKPLVYSPRPAEPATRRVEVKRRTGLVLGQKPTINRTPSTAPVKKIIPGTGKKLVTIGTSTGGPQALQAVITRL
ncbi:MAG: response regulator, partial [Quinella sp. 3Q1]|nr:response regulator [Quinella sp. 3Q1]